MNPALSFLLRNGTNAGLVTAFVSLVLAIWISAVTS